MQTVIILSNCQGPDNDFDEFEVHLKDCGHALLQFVEIKHHAHLNGITANEETVEEEVMAWANDDLHACGQEGWGEDAFNFNRCCFN